MRDAIAELPCETVLIHHEDSIAREGLQAADFVAWALFQKYARNADSFYRIIEERIVVEELIAQELW